MIDAAICLRKSTFKLDARFTVPDKGVTGVYGPSGCGKTTLLRALAGLEPATRGHIQVSGRHWLQGAEALPVPQRRVGFVFQQASIFPHLTVQDNLLYGRKRSKKSPYKFDFDHICSLLNLTGLRHREGAVLSGGERQRVAIGRALLASPAALLMDEPLSAVDQNARQNLITTLEKLFQEIEIPVFYVSHASEEIARLAESLILMEQGSVCACGELRAVLGEVDSPLNGSDEAFSVLRCDVSNHDLPYLTSVTSAGGAVMHIPRQGLANHTPVRLRIRARDVSISMQAAQASSILNILPATVVAIATHIEQGSRAVKLDIAGDSLLARISEHSIQQLRLQPGNKVFAQIKTVSLI